MIGEKLSNILKRKANNYQITLGDCVAWAKKYKGEKFHALFCDAPYHLTSIVSRYGKDKSKPPKDGVYARSSKGFMGKTWDGGDVAFKKETWEAFKEIMYPGAFGMSFASSRGWHRLAVAIEDAGFIIHPSMFGWCYGSGFPKATRIDTQIDQDAGVKVKRGKAFVVAGAGDREDLKVNPYSDETKLHEAQTELARDWQGYRYGLQALKPALEPIIVFQKPYQGRAIDNITKTGAGALNIEGGRIGLESIKTNASNGLGTNGIYGYSKPREESEERFGRWPANFFIDTATGEILDRQALKYTGDKASDFFFQVSTELDEADPVFYCAKANSNERDMGLESFEYKDGLGQQIKKSGGTAGIGNHNPVCQTCGGSKINRGNGVCKCKIPDWKAINNSIKNNHPTVKPIDLCEYLSTLLLPPDKYSPRRLFIPFSGVASEMIGAIRAGWDFVQGVEITKEYIPIAEARIKYWNSKPRIQKMFTQSEIRKTEKPRPTNLEMFEEKNAKKNSQK